MRQGRKADVGPGYVERRRCWTQGTVRDQAGDFRKPPFVKRALLAGTIARALSFIWHIVFLSFKSYLSKRQEEKRDGSTCCKPARRTRAERRRDRRCAHGCAAVLQAGSRYAG